MKKVLAFGFFLAVFCLLFLNCQKRPVSDGTYAEVLKTFQEPPAEFRSTPLWVWNDRVTKDKIDVQLADFKAHGIGGVFIHPRPGLITPYLTEEWLSLCQYAVDVGKSLGMKVWIYDENSYPSGFAGGHVPAQMPDAVQTGLRQQKMEELPQTFENPPILVLRKTASGFEDITQRTQEQASTPGEYYIFDLVRQKPSPWFGGFTYVDIMRRDVTEKFLDVTLNAYKRVIGNEFGLTVPGVFQDEAEIAPAGEGDVVNYTPALFDKFQAKWGYDLRLNLPSLFEEIGDWQRVRHNFYATLLGLFEENWAKPYYDYCAANKLIFTGHYWDHEWPVPRLCPDSMAMSAFAHMPGIDILMNNFQTDPHAQFGNARAVKEIRSAANQFGRPRTMSETYGASGWDLTFFDQKRIGDWEYALGVNFLNQHLSYMTIMGARKRDHPLSFSYHEPWWHAYNILADYFGRLSVAMSKGVQDNRILVIEPTTTAWMYYSPKGQTEHFKAIGDDFQNFVHCLEKEQVEYDLASEEMLKDFGRAQGKKMILGERAYELIILPPALENLNETTLTLITDYLAQDGKVLTFGAPSHFVNGGVTAKVEKLAGEHQKSWIQVSQETGLEEIHRLCSQELGFQDPSHFSGLLFHHRRLLKDAELVFLVNTSSQESSVGKFLSRGRSVEQWDPLTGKVLPYSSNRKGGKLEVSFTLPPGGSLLLCLRNQKSQKYEEPEYNWKEIGAEKEVAIKPEAPNVLTLDYCDLVIGEKVEKDLYFYDVQLETFKHHGLPRNPWDSAVQYKTNILDQDHFAPNSGFEATYWFTVALGVNLASLQIVVERPELYRAFINGRQIEPIRDRWWLDRSFGVFDIGAYAVYGKNKITLKVSPFTIHTELEPIYVLGDFRLRNEKKGFEVIPSSELKMGTWDSQGMPFYSGGVSYLKIFNIGSPDIQKDCYYVKLGDWRGVVAEIKVGNKTAGFIGFHPFELDISEKLSSGANQISVIVYGSLKNTLGPHHNNPPLGMAWPGSFQQGAKGGYPPGSKYSVVGYGLLEDFKLMVRTKQ